MQTQNAESSLLSSILRGHPFLAGKFIAYTSDFDGTKKDFSDDLEDQFSNIYHEDYFSKVEGRPSNRDEMFKLHEELLHRGARVSVERFDFIQANCFLIVFHLLCDGHSTIVNILVAEKDNKIARARVVGDSENYYDIVRGFHLCNSVGEGVDKMCNTSM